MKRQEKADQVSCIKEKFEQSQAVILTDFRGMTVKQTTELRKKLFKEGIEYFVFKNTLAKIAANSLGISLLDEYFSGPTAFVFAKKDVVGPAKVLAEFCKENEKLVIKAGLIEKGFCDAKQIQQLSKLPSRQELISKALGGIQGPLRNIVGVLQGPKRKMVYVLTAIIEKKQKGGEK